MDSELILFHGSPNEICVPKFGFGEDKHDYGKGFYLTYDVELAKEWAVCNSKKDKLTEKKLIEKYL